VEALHLLPQGQTDAAVPRLQEAAELLAAAARGRTRSSPTASWRWPACAAATRSAPAWQPNGPPA
jgi:hypothetical protein